VVPSDGSGVDLGRDSSSSIREKVGTNCNPSAHVSCNILSEADVRWMIYICGGSVRNAVKDNEMETLTLPFSWINRQGKIHLTLGLRRPRRDRQKTTIYSSDSRVLSLSWLLDAICNQCPRSLENCPQHFFL